MKKLTNSWDVHATLELPDAQRWRTFKRHAQRRLPRPLVESGPHADNGLGERATAIAVIQSNSVSARSRRSCTYSVRGVQRVARFCRLANSARAAGRSNEAPGSRCFAGPIFKSNFSMTLEEYNTSVRNILAEQQDVAQETARLALSGMANPANPQFAELMTNQWSLVQDSQSSTRT